MTAGRKPYGSKQVQQEAIVKMRLWLRIRRNGQSPTYTQVAHWLNNWTVCAECGEYFDPARSRNGCKKCGCVEFKRKRMPAPGGGNWTGPAVKRIATRRIDPEKDKSGKVVKRTLHANDYLNPEQLGLVLRACPARDRLIFETLLGTGMRPKVEFCQLQIRDLGVFQGQHRVDIRKGKRRVARGITISMELAAKLRKHRLVNRRGANRKDPVFLGVRGVGLSYKALHKRMKKLGVLAGVGRLNLYRVRHTFGTVLYEDRKDLFYVAEQMGHKNINVTRLYLHTSESQKSEQMEGFQRRVTEAEKGRKSTKGPQADISDRK